MLPGNGEIAVAANGNPAQSDATGARRRQAASSSPRRRFAPRPLRAGRNALRNDDDFATEGAAAAASGFDCRISRSCARPRPQRDGEANQQHAHHQRQNLQPCQEYDRPPSEGRRGLGKLLGRVAEREDQRGERRQRQPTSPKGEGRARTRRPAAARPRSASRRNRPTRRSRTWRRR